ncbi:MAG: AAA family ATPase, partial [Gammaproteobacteria bacterium]|nr:AAA family ATPase [Gammaproteobacteria bacterium]
MSSDKSLSPEQLCWQCRPEQFSFKTTDDLEELTEAVGQERALEAVQFGMGIKRPGYNLFVMGPSGMGRHTLIQRYLEQKSAPEAVPDDWCYVHNFELAHKPNAIRLPPGRASVLENDMIQLVEDLKSAIPTAFEADDYRVRAQEIEDELKDRQEAAFDNIQKEAEQHAITLMRTPGGYSFAPLREDKVMKPEDFDKLPEKEKEKIEAVTDTLQESLQNVLDQIPLWAKESREKIRELNREVTTYAVGSLIDQLRGSYSSLPEVIRYLDSVQQDVVDNSSYFLTTEEDSISVFASGNIPHFNRYQVNVLVDNSRTDGAPVIYEDNPVFNNLVGRVEHQSQMGTLVTDFTLIKPGALHRANGGYLVLDAHKVLSSPYAWEGLKRVLFSNEVRIESLGQALSLISTMSLEPESIPLDVKVVLIGDRELYYLLYEYDHDMAELFKVEADFENSIDRNEENSLLFARYIATLVKNEKM